MAFAGLPQGTFSAKWHLRGSRKTLFPQNGVCGAPARHFFHEMTLAGLPQDTFSTKWRLRGSRKTLFPRNGICGAPARHFFHEMAFAGLPQDTFSTKWHLRASRKPFSIRKDIAVPVVSLAVMSFGPAVRPSSSLPGQAGVDVFKDSPFAQANAPEGGQAVAQAQEKTPAG